MAVTRIPLAAPASSPYYPAMNAWAARLSPLVLLGLLGCREELGRCSNDESRLCVQAELAAGLADPDELLLRAVTDTGQRIEDAALPGVPAAFAARRYYVVEIDLSKAAMASRISITFT